MIMNENELLNVSNRGTVSIQYLKLLFLFDEMYFAYASCQSSKISKISCAEILILLIILSRIIRFIRKFSIFNDKKASFSRSAKVIKSRPITKSL
jgi:hypothetical protein